MRSDLSSESVPEEQIPKRKLRQPEKKRTEILVMVKDLLRDLEKILANTPGLADNSILLHGLDECLLDVGEIKKLLDGETKIDQGAIFGLASRLREIVSEKEMSAALNEILKESTNQRVLQRLESLLQMLDSLESNNEPESNAVRHRFRAAVESLLLSRSAMRVRAWIEDLWPIVNLVTDKNAVRKNHRFSVKR